MRDCWDNIKHTNIHIIVVPEGENKEQEIENLFEQIMMENFPNLTKEIDFQEVQEAQRVPKKLYPRRNTPRHIIITLPKIKDKERILKAAREKKNGPNERTDQSSRRNTTKQRRDSQPIRCTVQNTGNQEAHRIG